jgi:hypothetical protein
MAPTTPAAAPGGQRLCGVCCKVMFKMEEVSFQAQVYHKYCMRCHECSTLVTPGNCSKHPLIV